MGPRAVDPAVITVVGESLVDVIVRGGSSGEFAVGTDGSGEVTVHPGGSGEVTVHPGGSAANVAVALSRLGQRTALVTHLGADEHGALIRAHLERNGVHVVLAGPASAPTSRAIARLDSQGAATYQFDLSWDVRDVRLAEGSAALAVGSLGMMLAPGGQRVLRLLQSVSRRGDVVTSYDPNVRPSITPDRRQVAAIAEQAAAAAHIVKMSDEDLAFLFPGTGPEQLAARLLRPGDCATQVLLVTQGPHGAVVATRRSSFSAAAVPVAVVDTVGAGDAFMAALLAGLAQFELLSPAALAQGVITHLEVLREIVDQALAAAALTCARPGADPPTAAELGSFRAKQAP